MTFMAPFGSRETLWVKREASGNYRVQNVPVWIYGISVGALVRGTHTNGDEMVFAGIVAPALGATVRVMVPASRRASELYLTRIVGDANERGILLGPATFFDPSVVAIHLQRREEWWPKFGNYLNMLQAEGAVEDWEVGDPDAYSNEPVETADLSNDLLVHPKPTSDRDIYSRIIME